MFGVMRGMVAKMVWQKFQQGLVGVNYLGRSATTILSGLRRGSCRRSCRQAILAFPGAEA
jgi:hypothetical protein